MDLLWLLVLILFIGAAALDGRLGWVALALWVLFEKVVGS